ncbi:unnamed protein product, partial [Meganyctiphanes norvegica]
DGDNLEFTLEEPAYSDPDIESWLCSIHMELGNSYQISMSSNKDSPGRPPSAEAPTIPPRGTSAEAPTIPPRGTSAEAPTIPPRGKSASILVPPGEPPAEEPPSCPVTPLRKVTPCPSPIGNVPSMRAPSPPLTKPLSEKMYPGEPPSEDAPPCPISAKASPHLVHIGKPPSGKAPKPGKNTFLSSVRSCPPSEKAPIPGKDKFLSSTKSRSTYPRKPPMGKAPKPGKDKLLSSVRSCPPSEKAPIPGKDKFLSSVKSRSTDPGKPPLEKAPACPVIIKQSSVNILIVGKPPSDKAPVPKSPIPSLTGISRHAVSEKPPSYEESTCPAKLIFDNNLPNYRLNGTQCGRNLRPASECEYCCLNGQTEHCICDNLSSSSSSRCCSSCCSAMQCSICQQHSFNDTYDHCNCHIYDHLINEQDTEMSTHRHEGKDKPFVKLSSIKSASLTSANASIAAQAAAAALNKLNVPKPIGSQQDASRCGSRSDNQSQCSSCDGCSSTHSSCMYRHIMEEHMKNCCHCHSCHNFNRRCCRNVLAPRCCHCYNNVYLNHYPCNSQANHPVKVMLTADSNGNVKMPDKVELQSVYSDERKQSKSVFSMVSILKPLFKKKKSRKASAKQSEC